MSVFLYTGVYTGKFNSFEKRLDIVETDAREIRDNVKTILLQFISSSQK